jgi:hypothetical protein
MTFTQSGEIITLSYVRQTSAADRIFRWTHSCSVNQTRIFLLRTRRITLSVKLRSLYLKQRLSRCSWNIQQTNWRDIFRPHRQRSFFHHSIGLNAPHSKIIIPESLSHIRACSGLTPHYDHVRGKSIHAIGLNLLIKFYRSIKLNKTFYSHLYVSIVLWEEI